MNILVRMPNWLGDMVMAVPLLKTLKEQEPEAKVSLIVKSGLQHLAEEIEGITEVITFDRTKFPGFWGPFRFGQSLRSRNFDLYLSLPDSFSSALMGWGAGARARAGYRKEMRQALLTHSYNKPSGLHRAEEYLHLLELYTGKKSEASSVIKKEGEKKDYIIVNINSEAQSRRLTTAKAVELLTELRATINTPIKLIGAPKEAPFVESVLELLPNKKGIESLAGKTNVKELMQSMCGARLMLTTDTGPAHLANALSVPTIVLFGAGNENNTAPYNKENLKVIRLGKLSCEPCVRNVCVQFSTPQCLELLDSKMIVSEVQKMLNEGRTI